MWNREQNKKKQISWKSRIDMKTSGGVEYHRKRKERCKEQDWESQKKRLGWENIARSLGRGKDTVLGQCSSGKAVDTDEANDTDKHIGKGVFLYSEPSATTLAQGPHREHREYAETLSSPWRIQPNKESGVDRACELPTNNSVIDSLEKFQGLEATLFLTFCPSQAFDFYIETSFQCRFLGKHRMFLFSTSAWPFLNSEKYPQRYPSDLQFVVKPCKISLAAPRKWGKPTTGIAQTHPLHHSTSREGAADPCMSVTTWKNLWFDTW